MNLQTSIIMPTGSGQGVATTSIGTTGYQTICLVGSSGDFIEDDFINSVFASSPRISGNRSLTQNLFAIQATNTKLRLENVTVYSDYTALYASPVPIFELRRMSSLSGGVQLSTKNFAYLDTSQTFQTGFMIFGAARDDLGPPSNVFPISGNISGVLGREEGGRMHTAIGEVSRNSIVLYPNNMSVNSIILNSNESVCVVISGNATGANTDRNVYFATAMFDLI